MKKLELFEKSLNVMCDHFNGITRFLFHFLNWGSAHGDYGKDIIDNTSIE